MFFCLFRKVPNMPRIINIDGTPIKNQGRFSLATHVAHSARGRALTRRWITGAGWPDKRSWSHEEKLRLSKADVTPGTVSHIAHMAGAPIPRRLMKSKRDFMGAIAKRNAMDVPPPAHAKNLRDVQHPGLLTVLLLICANNPLITRAGAVIALRATDEWDQLPVKPQPDTVYKYFRRIKPLIDRRNITQDKAAAEAFVPEFRREVVSEGYELFVNCDESQVVGRASSDKAVSGTTIAHPGGPIVGMIYTCWSDGTQTPIVVGTGADTHQGMEWSQFPRVRKIPERTHWIPGYRFLAHILGVIMPEVGRKGRKTLMVVDGCPTHFTNFAKLAYLCGVSADGEESMTIRFDRAELERDDLRNPGTFLRLLGWEVTDVSHREHVRKLKRTMSVVLDDGGVRLKVRFTPPNTTGLLQPCDVKVFGAFKAWWKGERRDELYRERVHLVKSDWAAFLASITFADMFRGIEDFFGQYYKAQWHRDAWKPLLGDLVQ